MTVEVGLEVDEACAARIHSDISSLCPPETVMPLLVDRRSKERVPCYAASSEYGELRR